MGCWIPNNSRIGVRIIGAAEDEHHDDAGGALEVEHAQRDEAVGLGEQRAGAAAMTAADAFIDSSWSGFPRYVFRSPNQ